MLARMQVKQKRAALKHGTGFKPLRAAPDTARMDEAGVAGRHSAALAAFADGRHREALELLRAEVAKRLGEDLLNDLGVVALETDGPAAAGGVLQAAALISGGEEVDENLATLRGRRLAGFSARLVAAVAEGALSPPLPDDVDELRYSHG